MKKNKIFASALIAGCLLASSPLAAQNKTVRLTTAKEMGSQVTLLVNYNNKGVTVDWGDGQAVAYTTAKDDGVTVIEGTTKGNIITIKGNFNWKTLGCANNQITKIDLSEAKDLTSLYCQNNEIDTLNLTGMTQLVDLDCSFNKLKKLVLQTGDRASTDLASIENLNISNNELSGSYYYKLPTLQTLNISNNAYTTCYVYDKQLKSLNCANNAIEGKTLALNSAVELSNLICNGNGIKAIVLANNGAKIRQLICDDNTIQSLNLSNAEELIDLSCKGNGISDLQLHKSASMSSLNLSDNNLTFAALPGKSKKPAYIEFEPQAPFDISKCEGIVMNSNVPTVPLSESWSDKHLLELNEYTSLLDKRPDADYAWFSVQADGSETEMTRRSTSSGTEDYYASYGKFAFFTPQKKAYAKFTSKTYGFTIQSTPVAIGNDITAVDQVISNGKDLSIAVTGNTILLKSSQEVMVSIFTLDGKTVWQGMVNPSASVQLPKGVYVVNGKKVIL
ncbi:leucine Rich Repeat domain protein [gut metagenome]|uniref:Leucine Rich Repeat domain protein n=1 Tax=gut metagenome TaxID=749906 RepID=J9GMD4_9ZZZZ